MTKTLIKEYTHKEAIETANALLCKKMYEEQTGKKTTGEKLIK